MKPAIVVDDLSPEQLQDLDLFYRKARLPRVRTRAQMVLLSAEKGLSPSQIASIVRSTPETVRTWLKRYRAEGTAGLVDQPRPGAPRRTTPEYRARLLEVVRQRPRSLEMPYSSWTLQALADFMALETSIRVSIETIRRILKVEGIALRRPQHKITSPDPEYALKKRRLKSNETI